MVPPKWWTDLTLDKMEFSKQWIDTDTMTLLGLWPFLTFFLDPPLIGAAPMVQQPVYDL